MRKTTKFYLLVAFVLLLVHGSSSEHEFERETRYIQENNDLHPDKVLVYRQDYKSQIPVSRSLQQNGPQNIGKTRTDINDDELNTFNKQTRADSKFADRRQSSRRIASMRYRRCGTRSADRRIDDRSNSLPLQSRKGMNSDTDVRLVRAWRETASIDKRVSVNRQNDVSSRRQTRSVEVRVKGITHRQSREDTPRYQSQRLERRSLQTNDHRRMTRETRSRRHSEHFRRSRERSLTTRRDASSVLREGARQRDSNRRASLEIRANDVSRRLGRSIRDISRRDSVDIQESRSSIRHRSSERMDMRTNRVTRQINGRYITSRTDLRRYSVQRDQRNSANRRVNNNRLSVDSKMVKSNERRISQRRDLSSTDRSQNRSDTKDTRRYMKRRDLQSPRQSTRQAINMRRDSSSSIETRSSSRRQSRDRATSIDTRVTRTIQREHTRRVTDPGNRQTKTDIVRDTRRNNDGSRKLYRHLRNSKLTDESDSRRYRHETRSVGDSRARHYNRQNTRGVQGDSDVRTRQILNANMQSNERRVNSNNNQLSAARYTNRRNTRSRHSTKEDRYNTRQPEERRVTSRRTSSEYSTRRSIIEKDVRSTERRINVRQSDRSNRSYRHDARRLDHRSLRDRSSTLSMERRSNVRSFDGRNTQSNIIDRTAAVESRSSRTVSVRASSRNRMLTDRGYRYQNIARAENRRVLVTSRSNRMSARRDTSRRSVSGDSRVSRRTARDTNRRNRLSVSGAPHDERMANRQRRSAERITARNAEYSRVGRRVTSQKHDRRVESINLDQQRTNAKHRTTRRNTRRYSELSTRRQTLGNRSPNSDEMRTMSVNRPALTHDVKNMYIVQNRQVRKSFRNKGSRIETMHRGRRDSSAMGQRLSRRARRFVTESSESGSARRVNHLPTRRIAPVITTRMHYTEARTPADPRAHADEIFIEVKYPATDIAPMLQELLVDTSPQTKMELSNITR